jgi:hypothetical protein
MPNTNARSSRRSRGRDLAAGPLFLQADGLPRWKGPVSFTARPFHHPRRGQSLMSASVAPDAVSATPPLCGGGGRACPRDGSGCKRTPASRSGWYNTRTDPDRCAVRSPASGRSTSRVRPPCFLLKSGARGAQSGKQTVTSTAPGEATLSPGAGCWPTIVPGTCSSEAPGMSNPGHGAIETSSRTKPSAASRSRKASSCGSTRSPRRSGTIAEVAALEEANRTPIASKTTIIPSATFRWRRNWRSLGSSLHLFLHAIGFNPAGAHVASLGRDDAVRRGLPVQGGGDSTSHGRRRTIPR